MVDSVYGGGVVASQLTGGVSDITEEGGGFYNLGNAYSSPTGSLSLAPKSTEATFGAITENQFCTTLTATTAFGGAEQQINTMSEAEKTAVRYDPDLLAGGPNGLVTDDVVELVIRLTKAEAAKMNMKNLGAFEIPWYGA